MSKLTITYGPGYRAQDHDQLWHSRRLSRDHSDQATFAHEPPRRVREPQTRYWDAAIGAWRLEPKPVVRIDFAPRRPKGHVVRPRTGDADGVPYRVRDAVTGCVMWRFSAGTLGLARMEAERLAVEAGFGLADVLVERDFEA